MNLKSIFSIFFILFISVETVAQDNIFLSRDYWKANPSVVQIKKDVAAGHDPAQLNKYAFDAVVYALLEKANDPAVKYLLTLEGNGVEKRTHDSRTYIFWSAYKGNTNIMKHLFDKGAIIDIKDSHGNTPVTFAAVTGQKNMEVYDLFEKQGAVLTQEKNKDGVNALLLIAPYLEREKELSYFLGKGFGLDNQDPKGNNIFNYAARNGNQDFLEMLIEKGVAPNKVNKEGGNAMLYASRGSRNRQNTLETYVFLENLGVEANVVGDQGRNPLHEIAYGNEDLDIYTYFIKKGVDVNLQDSDGASPFMNAANSNDLKVVGFLSTYVNDLDLQDKKGRSALGMAVRSNKVELVAFLLQKGADVQVKDTKGNSLVYYLLDTFKEKDTGAFEAKLKLLEAKGLSMKQLQNAGNTALHLAAEKGDLALLERLTSFDIDVNTKNDAGYTALHIAAMKSKNDAMLKFLMSKGADKTIKTEFEETVLELALENELLQKQNVNLNFLQ